MSEVAAEQNEMSVFKAYNSYRRLGPSLFASICFLVGSMWMAGLLGEVPNSLFWSPTARELIGWLTIPFFSFLTLFLSQNILDRRLQLQIDSEGFYWAPYSTKTIPWAEIAHIHHDTLYGQEMIALHLASPKAFWGKGLLGALRKVIGQDSKEICVALSGTTASLADALWAIDKFRSGTTTIER